jgi:hypothetical protein
MAARGRANPMMRFAQRIADVAAVAQARYGERLEEERERLGRPLRRADKAGAQPGPSPAEAGPARAAAQGSDKHQESREKIGDPDAPPAPPESTSLPEPCRQHVLPHGAWPTL